MSVRTNDDGQANKGTPARTRPTIESEIPFRLPGLAIQLSPRGCGCLGCGLKDEGVEEENRVG